jgi:hypothetical protein
MQLDVRYLSVCIYHRSNAGCLDPCGGGVKHGRMCPCAKWESNKDRLRRLVTAPIT